MFAISGWFSSGVSIDVAIDAEPNRKSITLSKDIGDGQQSKALIFTDGEDIAGTATINIQPGKKLDHFGIKVELIGHMEFTQDRSQSNDFFAISKDLEPSGTIFESKQYKWRFASVDKTCETYWGSNVQVRYFVRVTVLRQYTGHITKELDFAVQNLYSAPEVSTGIKMEVGIEDCLHIEFEYDKSKYHTKDVVIGKVFFLLVRLKIKHMQLDIVRKETVGPVNPSSPGESETVAKYEIMDGAPVKNECIPVRLYLSAYDLSPSLKTVKFSVRYFLNLVLLDEEDRRYFKQQEIVLWRKKIG